MKGDYFIYVGNAYQHKNLKRLIQAMVLLNKKTQYRVELKIVSSRNVFTQKLQAEIDNNYAGKFVTLLGKVDDNLLEGLYNGSIGFIFPSLSEGFGLPGIEAMRAGTLVLASDIQVFREIYKDNAIYFNPHDLNSMKTTMECAINMNINLRNEKIKKAKDFVKLYSWAKMAKETLEIYADCNNLRPGK